MASNINLNIKRTSSIGLMAPVSSVKTPQYRLALATALITASTGSFNYFKASPTMPSLIEEFNIAYGIAGTLAGAFGVPMALLSLPAGMLIIKYGLRKITTYALTFSIIGSLIVGLAPNMIILLIGRIAEGIGMALILVAAPSIVSEVSSAKRVGFGMGILMIFTPLGNILGLDLGSCLVDALGWRSAWLAGVILPMIGLLLLTKVNLKRQEASYGLSTPRLVTIGLRNLDVWLLSIVHIGLTVLTMAFMIWGPTYVSEVRSLNITYASFVISLFMVVGIPTPLIGGWISDRILSRKKVMIPSFLAIAALFPLIVSGTDLSLPILVGLIGIFAGLTPSIIHASVYDLLGSSSGLGYGLLNTSRGIAMLIGPALFGVINDITHSWFDSFVSLSIFSIISLTATILMTRLH